MNNQGSLELSKLAAYIDHTYLKPDATPATIQLLCEEAAQYHFYSVCVNGRWVSLCRELLNNLNKNKPSQVGISAVCGFPLGAMSSSVKAFEAALAVDEGATEIDMVISVGSLLIGDIKAVEADIRAVVTAVEGQAIVKVIMETGMLSDEQKRLGCRIAEQAGAHYVKTSTGFGPGGATEADITLMKQSVSATMGVKASGGVRDYTTAITMIRAGATRIGTSSGIAIIQGSVSNDSY
ncbi:MAG: deoxyribose-phosphate aldolase [Paenibacillaceae bacterium]